MKKLIIYLTFGCIAIIAVMGLFYDSKPNTLPTVAGVFNITGYGAFAGEDSKNAFIMAIEDNNTSSSSFKTVIEDTQSDQKRVVTTVTKVINNDKAIAIIGPEWTEFGEVVSPIIEQYKVPIFSPWIVSDASFVHPPYFWSMTPSDRSEHIALTKYLKTRGLNKITIIESNNFWSKVNTDMFKQEAIKLGLTIISEYETEPQTTDFRTVLSRIKLDKPDAIYSAIADDQGHASMLSQIKSLSIKTIVATHSARATSNLVKNIPELLAIEIFAQVDKSSRYDEFQKKYEVRFGRKASSPSAAATYDAMTIITSAIKNGAETSTDILNYINKMKPFEGYSGPISFDKDGKLPLREASVYGFDEKGEVKKIQ